MQIISNIDDIDILSLSNFVLNHPNGNIFQTHEMYKVYQNTKNFEPIFIAVENSNEEILGILVAVIQKEYSGIVGKFSARAMVLGGPLIKDSNPVVLEILLKKFNQLVKRKAVFSQIRNMWDWGELKESFIDNKYVHEEHLNILIDLKKDEEQLWKDVFSKRRNEIRRAKKEGCSFYVKNTMKDLSECYSILQSVYKRVKLPIPNLSFFKNIYENSSDRIGLKMFCAEYEDKIIGCMLALVYKDTIYDFYAGAYSNFYNKYPNDLIPWEILLWGKKNGYRLFDFGGAGKPNIPYGVRDYKKKFGGRFVEYGRFEKVHKAKLMKIAKFGFMIWKKLK